MNSAGQVVPATFVTDLNGNPIVNPNQPNTSSIAGTRYNANQYFNAQGDPLGNITDINPNNYLIGPVQSPGVNATLADAISIGLQARAMLSEGTLAVLDTIDDPEQLPRAGLAAGFALIGLAYMGPGFGNPQQAYTLFNSDGTTQSVVNQHIALAFQDWASFALGVTNQVYLGKSPLAVNLVDKEIEIYPAIPIFGSTAGPATIARNQISGEGGANFNLGSSVSEVASNRITTTTPSGPVIDEFNYETAA